MRPFLGGITEGKTMLVAQARLPLAVPMRARVRSMRRPFHPSQGQGPYRLPRDVQDRLSSSLAPYRNREAAFALAVFLGSAQGLLNKPRYLGRRMNIGQAASGLALF
jgi:hypothetical protein